MPADSALGGYSATSKFNVAFNGIPIPIVSSRYGGGIDVVSVKYIKYTNNYRLKSTNTEFLCRLCLYRFMEIIKFYHSLIN